jgi:glycerol-3-phosphate dehydrogenase
MRRDVAALAGASFDVVVLGGGMHGAWTALLAARSGARVALLERDDFGSGTSANSLKILHGGLRYLQHLDLRRMRASIDARREQARCFPHLFEPQPFLMPLRGSGLRSPWVLGPALAANDIISFDRNRGVAPGARLPRGRLLSRRRCAAEMAPLVNDRPAAGALWWDGVARDSGRLVLEAVLEAARAGAVVANHVRAARILHAGGRVHGVAFTDRLTGRTAELHATQVVNATGPWAAGLARESSLPLHALPQAWIGAMNVVLRRSLGTSMGVALSAPQEKVDQDAVFRRSARELFFVPWRGRTLVGTDYFPVLSVESGSQGPPAGAVAGFIAQAAALAPRAQLSTADVALVHWGLMPLELPGDPLPRKTPLVLTDRVSNGVEGLVTVIGEKLTSAPVVARRVLAGLGIKAPQLPAAGPAPEAKRIPGRLPDTAVERLRRRYGRRWLEVAGSADGDDPQLFEPLVPEHPVLEIELLHAIRQEMAITLADLVRRTGLGDAGPPGAAVLQALCAWVISHAGWNADGVAQEAAALDDWFASRQCRPEEYAAP